ncbi:unnamed protein product, partial [Prorocentrum cordatum]
TQMPAARLSDAILGALAPLVFAGVKPLLLDALLRDALRAPVAVVGDAAPAAACVQLVDVSVEMLLCGVLLDIEMLYPVALVLISSAMLEAGLAALAGVGDAALEALLAPRVGVGDQPPLSAMLLDVGVPSSVALLRDIAPEAALAPLARAGAERMLSDVLRNSAPLVAVAPAGDVARESVVAVNDAVLEGAIATLDARLSDAQLNLEALAPAALRGDAAQVRFILVLADALLKGAALGPNAVFNDAALKTAPAPVGVWAHIRTVDVRFHVEVLCPIVLFGGVVFGAIIPHAEVCVELLFHSALPSDAQLAPVARVSHAAVETALASRRGRAAALRRAAVAGRDASIRRAALEAALVPPENVGVEPLLPGVLLCVAMPVPVAVVIGVVPGAVLAHLLDVMVEALLSDAQPNDARPAPVGMVSGMALETTLVPYANVRAELELADVQLNVGVLSPVALSVPAVAAKNAAFDEDAMPPVSARVKLLPSGKQRQVPAMVLSDTVLEAVFVVGVRIGLPLPDVLFIIDMLVVVAWLGDVVLQAMLISPMRVSAELVLSEMLLSGQVVTLSGVLSTVRMSVLVVLDSVVMGRAKCLALHVVHSDLVLIALLVKSRGRKLWRDGRDHGGENNEDLTGAMLGGVR